MLRQMILLLVPTFIFLGCQTTPPTPQAPPCGVEIRAAFDVGSGSTKMKVAELNTCTNKIVSVLAEEQVKVDYRDALDKSKDDLFPPATMESGMKALEKLKGKAIKKGAKKFTGVATAAFRQAKNSEEFVKNVREKLGIPLQVISQNLEGLIGFQAASQQTRKDPAQLLMWDIGGGSQQMVILNDSNQPVIYLGQLASVSFKNQVIEKVQKKNIKKVNSPNPLKKSDVEKAVEIAKAEAKDTVPADIKNKIAQKPAVSIVGIGGVLSKSVLRQLTPNPNVTQEQLKKALDKRTGMTDKQIKDPFSATEVTNLALVYGYMKALNIKSYKPIDVNLVDGLWFQPEIWQ
ncbi:Exopolyphosphatase [compost metagenome]